MSAATAGELIPVGTRLRWMLLCRLLAITVIPAGLLLASTDRDVLRTALWTGVPWLLISLPSLLGPRLGRDDQVPGLGLGPDGPGDLPPVELLEGVVARRIPGL